MKSVKVSLNRAQKAVDKAIKFAETFKNLPTTNSIKAEDIYLPLNHLFNQAAKRAFEIKVTETTFQREVKFVYSTQKKVIDQVRFFGAMAIGERKIFDAAQKVANIVNSYADRGFVTGALSKLLLIQFVTEPHELEKYAILSYVALSPEGLEYLKNNPTKVEFQHGAVPQNLDDL